MKRNFIARLILVSIISFLIISLYSCDIDLEINSEEITEDINTESPTNDPSENHTEAPTEALTEETTEPQTEETTENSTEKSTELTTPLVHYEATLPAVEPTCTELGLTEGKYCTLCDEILIEQNVIEALGHTEQILPAVAPTCSEPGLTQGRCCSTCDKVFVPQFSVSVLVHELVIDEGVAPTCTSTGITEGSHCIICGTIVNPQEVMPQAPHVEVIDEYVDATCIETGLSEGRHCAVCGEVTVAQEIIEARGHFFYKGSVREPDCITAGSITYTCVICGSSLTEITSPATGIHTEYVYEKILPTCVDPGKDFFACSVCGKKTKTVDVPATGKHNGIVQQEISPTCGEDGKYIITCFVCGAETKNIDIPATGDHKYGEDDLCIVCGGLIPYTQGLKYVLGADGKSYEVFGIGDVTDKNIIIPRIYNDLPITKISSYAFEDNTTIESMVILSNITEIGNNAFKSSNIRSIVIGDGVNTISDSAFMFCNSLQSITIGDGIKSIGNSAFFGCNLEYREKNIDYIGQYVYDCTFLSDSTAYIKDGTIKILPNAFEGKSIQRVVIPNSITDITYMVFGKCTKLTDITFNGTKEEWKAIDKHDGWDTDTNDYIITCTDGTIAKDGTET